MSGEEYGMYNGYVAFDAELPNSYTNCWDTEEEVLDDYVSVHGGITYDRVICPDGLEMIPLTEIPAPEKWSDGIRCVGFDTAHLGDSKEKWNFQTCREETLSLMNDIKALIEQRG